jgi:hypothetical protein
MNMNMLGTVQLNEFSIWMKSVFQTGKIARREKLWCRTGDHARPDETEYITEYLEK